MNSDRLWVNILTGVSWITFLGILSWLVLFITTGEQITIVRWISYLTPWLAGLLIVFFVINFLFGKKVLAVLLLILAAPLGYPYAKMFIPSQVTVHDGQSVYKVMTYSKMGRNHDIDSVAKVVMSEKPDILFMQEIDEQDSKKLIRQLTEIYDGRSVYSFANNYYGLILSRYKITPKLKKGDFLLNAEIDLSGKVISVWNVHLQKALSNTDMQYKIVDQLSDKIAQEDGPKIVAGDFNATVINYPYRKINQQLFNAFEQAGVGLGFTFPSPARRIGRLLPFMRIDHIFYSNHFKIHYAYVVDDPGGSDHYPVVALLDFN